MASTWKEFMEKALDEATMVPPGLSTKHTSYKDEDEDKARWESRAKKEWEKIAKEKLEVEKISDAIYAFGSELATLRLLQKFRTNKKAFAGYSKNLGKFYFRLEV